MNRQKMIEYLTAYFPNFLDNKTINQMELLTMLAEMWGMGFNKGYDTGHEVGYEKGYDSGYSSAMNAC